MTDVEQKVVQMRFDDKEFDEKAKKTMKTLDKLNEKLSFDAVAKKSDAAFKEVTDNVEKIANQAYTIIDRVIDKIRNDIADKLVGYIKSATIDQVANGWQKYSDMTTAVGTLLSQGHKIEKVNKTLEDLSYFADETSYSFNDMLGGIAKFTAAGVKLDDAKTALMGISNWAAQSGQNAETASRVFGQLAQAMGSYMKKQDWMSVQTANMDTQEFRQTALDTAVALGTLKKVGENTYQSLRSTTKKGAEAFTINNFVESLTQGAWMTSEVMVETYKKYAVAVEKIKNIYDETDKKTGTIIRERQSINKDLIKQYQEIYNVTEETAKQELDKWSTVSKVTDEEIKNYATLNKMSEELADKKLNASYYNAVEEYSKRTRKSLKETEKDMEQWSEYISEFSLKAFLNAQEARTFTDVINSVKESAASAWRQIYTAIFGDYNEAKVLWTDLAEGLIEIFTDRLYAIADIFSAWKEAGGRTTMLQGMYAFGGGIKMFIDEIRAAWDDLITDGESGVSVLMSISEKIREAGFKFYLFMEALRDNGFFQDIAAALHNIKSFIDQVFGAFYDGVRDAVPRGGFFLNLLTEFSSILKELTSNFKLSDEAVDGLRRTFKGLTIFFLKGKKLFVQVFVKIVMPLLNAIFSVLGNIVEVVLTITGTIGDILEYFMPLDSESSSLVKILEVLVEVITTIIKLVGQGLTWVLKKIVPIIGLAIGAVTSLIGGIGELFNAKTIKMGAGSNLMKGFTGLKDKILEAWAPLKSFSETIDEYKNGKGLTNFLNLFTDITDGIGNRLLLALDATVGFLEVMGDSKFGKALGYAVKALRWVIRAGLWLFNNLFLPIVREIITELGMTVESVKGIIDERGILGLLDLIQQVFKTGIFGSLVNTINLINSVIGSNGLGKLFSRGAKALDSMASYFNAAKMNQAAEVMLKIVAAMGLLYTLLALITFLPVDRYEEMQKALIDFAIALGVVVGGVFVISAAAALAGGNLLAMAAGFIGVAIAIATALWALKSMVQFIDEVNVELIDKGTEKLMEILSAYSMFIFKTLGPLVLISAKWSGNIGGVGIAMAGMAFSIWLLLKTLRQVETIDPAEVQRLFDSLSGIYMVIAAATSLMVLASAGKDVHGISIAIASIGVAFAAIKMVLPLCKDVIAEKDVFLEGQEALATFGLFMVAFAASMYLVTSGVHGIITGLASILLFRAFANIVMGTILPVLTDIIKGLMEWAAEFAKLYSGMGDTFGYVALGAFAVIFIGLIAFMYAFTGMFRMLLDTWADIDTISMVAIAASIVGSLIIFSKLLIPAIEELSETISGMDTSNFWSLAIILGLMIAPVISIMRNLNKIIYNYSQMYGVLKNAKFAINIGLVNRQYSEIASMMSSISIAIVGLYGLMTAFLYLTSKIHITPGQMDAAREILIWTLAIVIFTIIPICLLFSNLMATLHKRITSPLLANINKSIGPAGIFSKTEDTITAIFRAIASTISIVAVIVPMAAIIMGILTNIVSKANDIDNFIKVFDKFALVVGIMMIGLDLLTGLLVHMTKSTTRSAAIMNAGNTQQFALDAAKFVSVMNAMKYFVIGILGTVTVIGLIATIVANTLRDDDYTRFMETLGIMTVLVLGIMGAFLGFIYILTKPLSRMVSIADPTAQTKVLTTIALSVLGLVSSLAIISFALIPAIKSLESMDLDKIITGFVFSFLITLVPALMMLVTALTDKWSGITNTAGGNIIGIFKMLAGVVAPMVAMIFILKELGNILKSSSGLDPNVLDQLNTMITILGVILGVAIGLGALAGVVPNVTAGILAVAAVCLAIGAAAALIAFAAEKIYNIYRDWTKLTSTAEALGEYRSEAMGDGEVKGIEDNTDKIIAARDKQNREIERNDAKYWGRRSPDKRTQGWGKWLDLGLAKGIRDNTRDVTRSVGNLAKLTNSVFEDELEIASPSKVMYKNGRFIVAGIEEGVTSKKTSLADTMSDISDTIATSIGSGFENIDIDIFGGKTLEDFVHEFTDGKDAGSIIGKMLGLDDEKVFSDEYLKMVKTVGHEEIERLAYTESMGGKTPEWFANRFVNKSLGSKIGDKIITGIGNFFGSVDATNVIKKIGSDLGLEITDGATGTDVLTSLKNKIIGDGNGNGVIDTIKNSLTSGDWANSIGAAIGGDFINGIIDTLENTDLGQRLKMIFSGSWPQVRRAIFGGAMYDELVDVGTVYNTAFDREKNQPIKKKNYDYLKFNAKQYKDFRSELDEDVRDFLDIVFKENSELTLKLPDNVNGKEFFNLLKDDFGPNLSAFLKWINAGANKGAKKYGDEMVVTVSEIDDDILNQIGNKDWKIGSPSKVMEEVYTYVGEGAIVGLKNTEPKIIDTIKNMDKEQYRQMSLGVQALDKLSSNEVMVTPRLVPIVDTASMASFNDITDVLSGNTNARVQASLDYTGSMSFLATGQAAITNAINTMKSEILRSLAKGEFIKVDVNSEVNDNNLFDHFVSIERQEYNRTGMHAW